MGEREDEIGERAEKVMEKRVLNSEEGTRRNIERGDNELTQNFPKGPKSPRKKCNTSRAFRDV